MKLSSALAAAATAVGSSVGLAQAVYTFEMRLIPDGVAEAPTGPGTTFNIGDPGNVHATRIGFWLQARVNASSGQNWGIARASPPPGEFAPTSFITVSDPAVAASMSRGTTNAANTNYGRFSVYRNGGPNTGNTGNAADSAPFPGNANNENGALDSAGPGAPLTRVYGFDCFIGVRRTPVDQDNPTNPWGVNGAISGPSMGNPVPPGEFAPWANLYRVWIDLSDTTTPRTIELNTTAWLNAGVFTFDNGYWPMTFSEGQLASASYSFTVTPAPGAAALLVLALPAAGRRRR